MNRVLLTNSPDTIVYVDGNNVVLHGWIPGRTKNDEKTDWAHGFSWLNNALRLLTDIGVRVVVVYDTRWLQYGQPAQHANCSTVYVLKEVNPEIPDADSCIVKEVSNSLYEQVVVISSDVPLQKDCKAVCERVVGVASGTFIRRVGFVQEVAERLADSVTSEQLGRYLIAPYKGGRTTMANGEPLKLHEQAVVRLVAFGPEVEVKLISHDDRGAMWYVGTGDRFIKVVSTRTRDCKSASIEEVNVKVDHIVEQIENISSLDASLIAPDAMEKLNKLLSAARRERELLNVPPTLTDLAHARLLKGATYKEVADRRTGRTRKQGFDEYTLELTDPSEQDLSETEDPPALSIFWGFNLPGERYASLYPRHMTGRTYNTVFISQRGALFVSFNSDPHFFGFRADEDEETPYVVLYTTNISDGTVTLERCDGTARPVPGIYNNASTDPRTLEGCYPLAAARGNLEKDDADPPEGEETGGE